MPVFLVVVWLVAEIFVVYAQQYNIISRRLRAVHALIADDKDSMRLLVSDNDDFGLTIDMIVIIKWL